MYLPGSPDRRNANFKNQVRNFELSGFGKCCCYCFVMDKSGRFLQAYVVKLKLSFFPGAQDSLLSEPEKINSVIIHFEG